MTRSEAEALACEQLERRGVGEPEGIVITSATETSYGWVLTYNSRRYLETKDMLHMLVGQGPVVVVSATREVHELGSASPPAVAQRALEARLGLTP